MMQEQRLILELCKFDDANPEMLERLLRTDLNAPYLLGQLLYNRMGAVAYYTLFRNRLLALLDRESRCVLQTAYDASRVKAQSFQQALGMLADILNNFTSRYALLKGALLAQLYPEGLRTSSDIDILLDTKDITALSACLKTNGFIQGAVKNGVLVPATRAEIISSRLNRGETVPFLCKFGLAQMPYCEIDINFSLGYKAECSNPAVKWILQNTRPLIKTANGSLDTLESADFFLHLCAHLYKEASIRNWVDMGRDLSLYKFCDIYLYVRRFFDEGLCRKILARAGQFGLEKDCYFALIHTKALFDVQNKWMELLLDQLRPSNLSYLQEVYEPGGRTFRYDMPFVQWFFHPNRRGLLYATENEAS